MVFGGVKIEGPAFFSTLRPMSFLALLVLLPQRCRMVFHRCVTVLISLSERYVSTEVGGYANNLHIPSGDDEFLMQKVFKFTQKEDRFVHEGKQWSQTHPFA